MVELHIHSDELGEHQAGWCTWYGIWLRYPEGLVRLTLSRPTQPPEGLLSPLRCLCWALRVGSSCGQLLGMRQSRLSVK